MLCLTLSSAAHSPWRGKRTLLEALVAAMHRMPIYAQSLASQAGKGPRIHKSLPSLRCFLIAWLLNLQCAELPFFPTNTNSKYFKSIELHLVFGSTVTRTVFSLFISIFNRNKFEQLGDWGTIFYPRLPLWSLGQHIRFICLKNFWVVNLLLSLSLQPIRGTARINQSPFLHKNQ